MRWNQWMTFFAVVSVLASTNVVAANAPVHEQLQVPNVLQQKLLLLMRFWQKINNLRLLKFLQRMM